MSIDYLGTTVVYYLVTLLAPLDLLGILLLRSGDREPLLLLGAE